MTLLTITLVYAALVAGYLIGHARGRRRGQEEGVEAARALTQDSYVNGFLDGIVTREGARR